MSYSSIWPIDRTLTGATTPGQSGPGSDGNEEVLYIPQSSSDDGLVSYIRTLVGWVSYPFTEMQSVYSTPPQPTDLMRVMEISITVGAPGTVLKGLEKRTWGFGNHWKNRGHPDDRILEIGQNTLKSPENLKRLAVRYPVEDHQLTQMIKESQGAK